MRRHESLRFPAAVSVVFLSLFPASPLKASLGGEGSLFAGGSCHQGQCTGTRGEGAPGKGVLLCEQFYEWTDEEGGVHFTDNAEDIPSRDRARTEEISMPDYPEDQGAGTGTPAAQTPPEETLHPDASASSAAGPAGTGASPQGRQGMSPEQKEEAAAAPVIIQNALPHGR